jgi:hypothetical protein
MQLALVVVAGGMLLALAPEELPSTILFLLKKKERGEISYGQSAERTVGAFHVRSAAISAAERKRNKPCSVGSVGVAPGAGTDRSGHGERAVRVAANEPSRIHDGKRRISKAPRSPTFCLRKFSLPRLPIPSGVP